MIFYFFFVIVIVHDLNYWNMSNIRFHNLLLQLTHILIVSKPYSCKIISRNTKDKPRGKKDDNCLGREKSQGKMIVDERIIA